MALGRPVTEYAVALASLVRRLVFVGFQCLGEAE
jgi:hypothetical protein